MKNVSDIRNCYWLCGIVLIACLLCTPFVEMGVNDDWSYIKTAQDLARTGHLVYNGWAAAMIGIQAYWGALSALIFGKESFTAVRLSMIPVSVGTVVLFYALCRRSGLSATLAFFGALTLGLSPMFVPYAVTFMTDVPSLFLILLSLYAYTRAWEEQENLLRDRGTMNRFLVWLSVGTVASMAGGTVRQIGWFFPVLAAFVMIRGVLRSDKAVVGRNSLLISHGIALVASVVFAVLVNRWFAHQPYAIHEELGKAIPEFVRTGVERFPLWKIVPAAVAYTLVLLVVPVLPLTSAALFPRKKSGTPVAVFLGVALILLLLQFLFQFTPPRRLFPWIQNTVTDTELWWDLIVGRVGYFPMWITKPQRFALSWIIVGLTTLLLTTTCLRRIYARRGGDSPTLADTTPFALQVYAPFFWLYLSVFLIKLFVPYSFGVLDRYLLPLLPGLILWLLHRWGESEPPKISRWASAGLLIVFAYYGIARTHDCFEQRRTVLAVSDRLTRLGIRRTLTKAGLEYNGWTQITTAGYYNDPRLVYPPGAYQLPQATPGLVWRDPFKDYTPVVKGIFFIVAHPQTELLDTATPPETYDCWFPPFRRAVYLQTSDPRFRTFVLPPL